MHLFCAAPLFSRQFPRTAVNYVDYHDCVKKNFALIAVNYSLIKITQVRHGEAVIPWVTGFGGCMPTSPVGNDNKKSTARQCLVAGLASPNAPAGLRSNTTIGSLFPYPACRLRLHTGLTKEPRLCRAVLAKPCLIKKLMAHSRSLT